MDSEKAIKLRIVLADDHTMMRSGLRLLLERESDFSIVGEAGDGRQAIEIVEAQSPDVVIMDIAMPNMNGIEAARRITDAHPRTAVVILSMHSDESYVLRALNAGARGYLLKDSAEGDLISAVRAVSEGKAFFSPAISKLLVDDYVRQLRQRGVEDSYELLTSRERELLQLLAEGKTTKGAATILSLSPHTVDTHRANLMHKLNLNSLPELILYAMRKGVIT
ncbi:MAG: response regulator transcription factor [Acidobacteriota bacterium]|nr:response regulator transcription factor [Acidobacteriota bacterium]